MIYEVDDDEYTIPEPLDASIAFKGIHVAAFANMESPGWIIKTILPKAELAVIYGEPGCGKSFMALDMAMSIALGKDWCGKRTKPQSVLYVCAEGAGGFKKRLLAYALHHKVDLNALTNFTVIAAAPNFLLKADAQAILKYAQIPVGVIIIDTFSRTMPGGNENSGEHMGFAISQCKILHHATGALVLLVHHSGKDAERGLRGWSGLKGAVDTEIEVTRVGDGRKGRISKQKDGEEGLEWGFQLDTVMLGYDEDDDEITTCVYVPTNNVPLEEKPHKVKEHGHHEKRIMNAFKAIGGNYIPIEELIDQAIKGMANEGDKRDTRRQVLRRAVNSLESNGYIVNINGMTSKV